MKVESGILRRWLAFDFPNRIGRPDGQFKARLERFAAPLLALLMRTSMDYLENDGYLVNPTGALRNALSAAVWQSDPPAAVILRHVRDLDGGNAREILQRITAIQERDDEGELDARRRTDGTALFAAGRKVTLNRVAAAGLALRACKGPGAGRGAGDSASRPTCWLARPLPDPWRRAAGQN